MTGDPISPPIELSDVLGELKRHEETIASWDASARQTAQSNLATVEMLHGEALRRLLRALKADPAAFAAMKEVAADEFVYAVLRRHGLIKPSLNERVEVALAGVRPMLASHGGDVELVSIAPPAIEVRFTGACDGCAASVLTFHAGVKKAVQDACPEITSIVQAKGLAGGEQKTGFVSPFALGKGGAWHGVCTLAALAEDALFPVKAGGEYVFLYRHGAAVTCFQDACAHLGYPVSDGTLQDGILSCVHHGFRYNLANGESLAGPDIRLKAHGVRIVDGRVEVSLAG